MMRSSAPIKRGGDIRALPTNTMKLPSAALEASPEAISDDAEHQKDGY